MGITFLLFVLIILTPIVFLKYGIRWVETLGDEKAGVMGALKKMVSSLRGAYEDYKKKAGEKKEEDPGNGGAGQGGSSTQKSATASAGKAVAAHVAAKTLSGRMKGFMSGPLGQFLLYFLFEKVVDKR